MKSFIAATLIVANTSYALADCTIAAAKLAEVQAAAANTKTGAELAIVALDLEAAEQGFAALGCVTPPAPATVAVAPAPAPAPVPPSEKPINPVAAIALGLGALFLGAANARVEELGGHIKEVKSENSKLRSALGIIHFKREPWQ